MDLKHWNVETYLGPKIVMYIYTYSKVGKHTLQGDDDFAPEA